MSGKNELVIVFCTVPDDATAEKLAKGLIEERLAACVNAISGVTSFYRWHGKLEADSEIQLVIKTSSGRFAELAAWITANHPYDVPEVVALPAAHVSEDYLAWAIEQTT